MERGPAERDGARLGRAALLVLSAGLFLLLAQALVPIDEFVHRSDDAFYYFKVAANYPDVGFWSFDSIHSTNGVQPLWAFLLSAVAVPLNWVGITDPDALARIFVGLAALFNFASAVVLFHLLSRKVSVGTGLAAAGAFLFPLGIVWARLWGLENSLYALLLISAIAYAHLVFRQRPGTRTAAVLGLLLGLTALARLNAALLIPCLLLAYLVGGGRAELTRRARLSAVAALVAAALLVPYFAWNYLATDHFLPVSGEAKRVTGEEWLQFHGVDSKLSPEFAKALFTEWRGDVTNFLRSRATDGLWLVGGRAAFIEAPRLGAMIAILAAIALLPLAARRPRDWLRFLRRRFARLSPFAYVLAFALLNAAVSAFTYPDQVGYAMLRWWLVETEVVIVVLVATLVAAAVAYLGDRFVARRLRLPLAVAALALLVAIHVGQTYRFYWDGKVEHKDWNLSWNDESYRAAKWLERNAPKDAVVGSWNAGVLGFYADQRVVNLDGLINDFELLPYIRDERIGDYVRREGIDYLSDLAPALERRRDQLRGVRLVEVYSHYSSFALRDYRIYRVEARR